MRKTMRMVSCVGALLVAVCAAGCRPDIQVKLDPRLVKPDTEIMPEVEVHLFAAANQSQFTLYSGMSMTEYWQNPTPPKGARVITLGADKTEEWVLARDPIWKEWERGKVLFVFSNYPRTEADQQRRLFLPIDTSHWPGSWEWQKGGKNVIPVHITSHGVVCPRPYKPAKW